MPKDILAVFNPNHTNANVHGYVTAEGGTTCSTGNTGINCTGCCIPLKIDDPKLQKEAFVDCPERITAMGCRFLTEAKPGRPHVCYAYHCRLEKEIVEDPERTAKDKKDAVTRLHRENYISFVNGEIDNNKYQSNQKRIDNMLPDKLV